MISYIGYNPCINGIKIIKITLMKNRIILKQNAIGLLIKCYDDVIQHFQEPWLICFITLIIVASQELQIELKNFLII